MFCYGYLDCLFDFIILFIYWKFFFFFPYSYNVYCYINLSFYCGIFS